MIAALGKCGAEYLPLDFYIYSIRMNHNPPHHFSHESITHSIVTGPEDQMVVENITAPNPTVGSYFRIRIHTRVCERRTMRDSDFPQTRRILMSTLLSAQKYQFILRRDFTSFIERAFYELNPQTRLYPSPISLVAQPRPLYFLSAVNR
jgi:hypothetical protein